MLFAGVLLRPMCPPTTTPSSPQSPTSNHENNKNKSKTKLIPRWHDRTSRRRVLFVTAGDSSTPTLPCGLVFVFIYFPWLQVRSLRAKAIITRHVELSDFYTAHCLCEKRLMQCSFAGRKIATGLLYCRIYRLLPWGQNGWAFIRKRSVFTEKQQRKIKLGQ